MSDDDDLPPTPLSLFYEWERVYHGGCPPESEGQTAQDAWGSVVSNLAEGIATNRAQGLADVRAKLMLLRHWGEQGSISPLEPHLIASAIADLMHLEKKEREARRR